MTLPSMATVGSAHVLVATILFVLAIIAKYLAEATRGYRRTLGPGSFIYATRVAPAVKNRTAYRVYRVTFHARVVLALLLPVFPLVAGAALAISLVAEMYVMFRYHLVLMAAVSLVLASLGRIPNLEATLNAPLVPYLTVLVAAMYSLSAIRKLRNGFTNGNVLIYGLAISLSKRHQDDHLWGSASLLRLADRFLAWPKVAKVVVGAELVIGGLLVVPVYGLNVVGAALAICAQLCFTALFPRTLLSFTLAVAASLALML